MRLMIARYFADLLITKYNSLNGDGDGEKGEVTEGNKVLSTRLEEMTM